ncbi:RNA methyltransferase [Jeotgalibacillus sp. ET6]|uniref:TRM11 family SAM-dependent methyltransferase n=1 Tax=Jeotgalibacillus sp. ET6 TaxID=3037260 RepID=UPI00241864F8|nr:RNA methyltransferase [Jeotgalibacillus sp. ET6]MDG5472042.1 RNA methyltransferase [Jeotgalibacillus sp. ET6]
MNKWPATGDFIYTYAYNEEEKDLCHLEMRSLFGKHSETKIVKTDRDIHPSRSPFVKERIQVLFEGSTLEELCQKLKDVKMGGSTFKVLFVKINDLTGSDKIEYEQKRQIERDLGMIIEGELDLHQPDVFFGLVPCEGSWHLGLYEKAEPVWLNHVKKPREYSTALSTRTARAAANIAVPEPDGKTAIDPCCGIGTVLVEALSMGINIVGRDINPLVVTGSRENIAHFGYSGDVSIGPIDEVTGSYDATIIDMPYNLYTHATPEEQLDILVNARHFTKRLVVVTIESIDQMLAQAGFTITDRCVVMKGKFSREILVCE